MPHKDSIQHVLHQTDQAVHLRWRRRSPRHCPTDETRDAKCKNNALNKEQHETSSLSALTEIRAWFSPVPEHPRFTASHHQPSDQLQQRREPAWPWPSSLWCGQSRETAGCQHREAEHAVQVEAHPSSFGPTSYPTEPSRSLPVISARTPCSRTPRYAPPLQGR
jgi:hypothetical protein